MAALLGDPAWAAPLAGELAAYESIGVLSLGWESLLVLEASAFAGGYHWMWADRISVLQGLGYLPFPAMQAPPEQADVVLLPGVASDDTTLWTYVGWADTALRARLAGRAVLAVIHPAARLSPADRAAYRPPAAVVATDLP